jgi:hypothetical protein
MLLWETQFGGREAMLKTITMQGFLGFFQEFKIRKARESGMNKWMAVPSPYDWTQETLKAIEEARRQRQI